MINKDKWRRILIYTSEKIIDKESFLCELDSYVGDGDHGLTVSRGFANVLLFLKENVDLSIYDITIGVAKQLGKTMGGAIGPIFQSVFLGMANATKDLDHIDKETLYQMLSKSLMAVKIIGGAKEGEKTLVDSLSPAVNAYKKCLDNNGNMLECFENATISARLGCYDTKNMIAKKGRAKFLGEKSKGYQDAGATTMYFIIQAINDCLKLA